MIRSRAVVDTRNTGRGPNGRNSAQAVHARASAAIVSSNATSGDNATMPQIRDHLTGQFLR